MHKLQIRVRQQGGSHKTIGYYIWVTMKWEDKKKTPKEEYVKLLIVTRYRVRVLQKYYRLTIFKIIEIPRKKLLPFYEALTSVYLDVNKFPKRSFSKNIL